MKRFKLLFVAIVAVFAVACMAASSVLAFGPTVLFGASGVTNGTVLIVSSILEPNNTTATALEAENAPLTGKGVLLELTYLRTPTHLLFDYLVLFLLVEHNGTLCNTERAVNKGEVRLGLNTAELVYYGVAPGATLQAGILFNVTRFRLICGEFEPEIEGSDLSSLKVESGQQSLVLGSIQCSTTTGVPLKTEYTNQKNELLKASLKIKAAGRTDGGCELVGAAGFNEVFNIASNSNSRTVALDL
jgi:hypothetical protein